MVKIFFMVWEMYFFQIWKFEYILSKNDRFLQELYYFRIFPDRGLLRGKKMKLGFVRRKKKKSFFL